MAAATARFWKFISFPRNSSFRRERGLLYCRALPSIQNTHSYVTLRNPHTGGEKTERSERRSRKCLFLLGVAFGSYVGFRLYDRLKSTFLETKTLLASDRQDLDSILEISKPVDSKSKQFNFVADVVEIIAPAVVHIFDGHGRGGGILGHMVHSSSGSGFLVTEDGLVLTNAHVVMNMRKVKVMLADGSTLVGDIVSLDPASDLAAVQLRNSKKQKFKTIKLGDSSTLRPGEFVVAMGSPLRLSNTVTSGIVSTVHRASGDLSKHLPQIQYIQTDAAINVGNSGGPLVNLDGEVIGINSMTVKDAVGISFAIPVNIVRDFLKAAVKRQSSRTLSSQGYIGIHMLTLTPGIIDELIGRVSWFPKYVKSGVFIPEVVFDSPSHRAGIYPGDVIVSINGTKVTDSRQVSEFVSKGELLTIEILRGPKQLRLMGINNFHNACGHYGEILPHQQPITACDFTGSNPCHIILTSINFRRLLGQSQCV